MGRTTTCLRLGEMFEKASGLLKRNRSNQLKRVEIRSFMSSVSGCALGGGSGSL